MNVWFYKSGFEVTAGESYLLKVMVDVPFCYKDDEDCDDSGKYTFAFKPSGLGISEAVAQGKLYELDPWFNISYAHKMPILANTESGEITYPILVNDTAFQLNETDQWVFCNLTVNTTWQPVGYLYFNNFTDYICVDPTETFQVRTDIVFGNGTAFGNPWSFRDLGVFHMESDPTLVDAGQYGSDCGKNGAPALTSDGKVANAVDFEASTNDYYTCGDDPFNDYTDELTVMTWLKIESTAAIGIFLSKWTSWFIGVFTDPKILAQANRDGTSCGSTEFSGISTGTWVHVAYVMGPNSCTLYIDGVNRSAVYGTGTISASANGLHIGRQTTSGEHYDGIMDEIIISNRSWSDDEIQAYYNNTEGTHNFSTLGNQSTNVIPPVIPNITITLPIAASWCADDNNLFVRSKDIAENGSAYFNEFVQFCKYGCSNWTLTTFGNPGCEEGAYLLAIYFIIALVIFAIIIRLAVK